MRWIGTTVIATALAAACLASAGPAAAGMNVNIGIEVPLPVIVVSAPPAVVVIPGTPVYYAPGLQADIFFYQGFWWTPNRGAWFRAQSYDGPWAAVPGRRVPPAFGHLPPNYREAVAHERPIPYGQFKKHWQEWDRDRERGHGPRDKDWKHDDKAMKHDAKAMKHDVKAVKHDDKAMKHDDKGHGKQKHDDKDRKHDDKGHGTNG
jgi:hypothetical protein